MSWERQTATGRELESGGQSAGRELPDELRGQSGLGCSSCLLEIDLLPDLRRDGHAVAARALGVI